MTYLAKKINRSATHEKIEVVSLSFDGKNLIFLFSDGQGAKVPRSRLPFDDATPISSIEIYDHGYAAAVRQASGSMYDLPLDSIKHYARGGKRKSFNLGKRLTSLRNEHQLTQAQLAWRTGISRMQLYRIEKGKSEPNLETLERLSKAFGITLATLVSQ